jgi:hypothetical protein
MFKREYLSDYLISAVIATIVFAIPMIIFLNAANYQETYLLYIGNFLFMIAIGVFVYAFNRRKSDNASTQTLKAAGHVATILGVILSVIVATIALVIFVPDVFGSGKSDTILENAPAQTGTGKTNGLVLVLYMSTIIGNFSGGSVASILIPITAKRDQTKDKKSEVLNN